MAFIFNVGLSFSDFVISHLSRNSRIEGARIICVEAGLKISIILIFLGFV